MGKIYRTHLNDAERGTLSDLISSRSAKSSVIKRVYVLQAADESDDKYWGGLQISDWYGISVRSIERIRKHLIENGFELTLFGKPRKVFKEKIFDGEVEAKLISLRCSDSPEGYNKWMLELLS